MTAGAVGGSGMRLTDDQLAEIRADVEGSWRHDPKYDADDMLALLGEVEALRADLETAKDLERRYAWNERSLVARAVAAEARITAAATDLAFALMGDLSDPAAVEAVERAHEVLTRAALVGPVATAPAPGGSDVNEILAASRAAVVEPAGEPPRPLEHTPFAMPDGAERCAADGLPWPCPAVGDPQPPTCATCNGTGLVCTLATWPYRSVPCPSAAPPDPRCKCGPFTYAGPEPYPATVTCARCGQIVNLRPPDHTCRPDYQNGVCLDCGEPSAYPDPAP